MEGTVTKGEFADLIGVSAGRVSQYLSEGKITPAALIGSGRSARIHVERAKTDLKLKLDISQRLGNGINTRLDTQSKPSSPLFEQQASVPASQDVDLRKDPDHQIKMQKLEQLLRANRNGSIAEARERGQLIDTNESRAELAKIAVMMLQIFEGALTDFAAVISSDFKLPQRDIVHLLRKEFRNVREKTSLAMQKQAVQMPETVDITLASDEIESLN